MEKRFFLAIFFTILVMAIYFQLAGRYVTPAASKEPQALVPKPQEVTDVNGTQMPALDEQTADDHTTVQGDLKVVYSTHGGYIKSLTSSSFDQTLPFHNIGFLPGQKAIDYTAQVEGNKLIFSGPAGARKTFIFEENRLQLVVIPQPQTPLLVFSGTLDSDQLSQRYQEFFYHNGAVVERKTFQNILPSPSWGGRLQGQVPPPEIILNKVKFAGVRDRYFCLSLLPGEYQIKWWQNVPTRETFMALLPPYGTVALYLGLQNLHSLQLLGLQDIIYYGFFHGIALILLKVLHLLFAVFQSWGLVIVLFGLLTYLILFPFTKQSTLAMKEMRSFQDDHADELRRLKEKYKDNPNKMHQETMELYKRYNFNPLRGCTSGCLPMLVQLPLVWAFWAVVPRVVEFKNTSFLWIRDLSMPDRLFTMPVSLPLGIGHNFNLLPVATACLMFWQMKLTTPPADPEQAQQQKIMGMIFPVMLIFFLYNLPSALLLYWLVQSAMTFIFQWRMMNKAKA